MFEKICTTEHWRQQRRDNLALARATKDITGGRGVEFWVIRAKRCHDIAMKRRPICGHHITVSNTEITQGAVWAS